MIDMWLLFPNSDPTAIAPSNALLAEHLNHYHPPGGIRRGTIDK